ncbi:MAG: TetR/AcrR family transcriptional regulator [Sulfuriflexus sp.]|nr:TetR/AcrR family transcriptional regulator [Sulfuriflexus sp.]
MLKQRNADQSRHELLEAASKEIHQFGFHAASISRILENTSLTRGALYHHFPSKLELGYAVIDELFGGYLRQLWLEPLLKIGDPIEIIENSLNDTYAIHGQELISYGCPLNNLSQEMSAIDEGFRERINAQYEKWQDALSLALQGGQETGTVRKDINAAEVAIFIVASIEGCIGLAKNNKSQATLDSCTRILLDYLYGLRVVPQAGRS